MMPPGLLKAPTGVTRGEYQVRSQEEQVMKRTRLLVGGLVGSSLLLLLGFAAAQQQAQPSNPNKPQQIKPGLPPGAVGGFTGQVPPGGAVPPGVNVAPGQAGPAPEVGPPAAFTSKEGKKGWKLVIPGNRPLATPAVVGGKVLVGGGFGSHEFYAFDAKTGKKLWLYRTGDDGPTAAAVADGYIAFNTESCELEILTLAGKRVWKKWLGDPLMSMPAISGGKVYMSYPDSKGDHKHYLACFDLKTGKEHWKRPVPGDTITAPVIADHKIYVATLDGTLSCFHEQDGKLAWKEKRNTTSSPMVWNGQCYYSRREQVTVKDKDGKQVAQQTELLAARPVVPLAPGANPYGVGGFTGRAGGDFKSTQRPADYLDAAKRRALSGQLKMAEAQDAAVGFAQAPAAAGLGLAGGNLGQLNVSGVWAFQGSRPFIYNGRMYTVMGDTVKCVSPKTDKVLWKKNLHDKKNAPLVDAAVTPPAIVNGKLFVGTVGGEVICLSAEDGRPLWKATVGEPVVFQPAVAGGRVYVSTSTGGLYCLETGDARDDGWLMWGATAAHNGLVQK
jgi:Ca-activated chloride channel family protein